MTMTDDELALYGQLADEVLAPDPAASLAAEPAASQPGPGPQFLAPGAEPRTREEIEGALEKHPVFLADFLAIPMNEEDRPFPSIGAIAGDDRALFYAGKANMLIGEAGKGKSAILQHVLIQEARAGRRVLFLDREKQFEDFAWRMRDQGCSVEAAANIAYWRPRVPLHTVMKTVLAFVCTYAVQVVMIDTLNRDLALCTFGCQQLKDNDNDHCRWWHDHTVEPLLAVGMTVISVDHLKKPDEIGGRPVASKGRSPKGGVAKLEVTTGTMVAVDTVEPFSRNRAGTAKLRVTKDNNGAWFEGESAAEFHVTPGTNGEMVCELRGCRSERTGDGKFRPTGLMEKVSLQLEGRSERQSVSAVKKAVTGNSEYIGVAIDRLIEDGFVDSEPGLRGAKMLLSIRPYRESEDMRAATVPPTRSPWSSPF